MASYQYDVATDESNPDWPSKFDFYGDDLDNVREDSDILYSAREMFDHATVRALEERSYQLSS